MIFALVTGNGEADATKARSEEVTTPAARVVLALMVGVTMPGALVM